MIAWLVSHAVHGEPWRLLIVPELKVGGVVDKDGHRLPEGRGSIGLEMIGQRVVELTCRKAEVFGNPVEVDPAEHQIMCTIPGNQILEEARKRSPEIEVGGP
ncbi:MAG: hypothetical protein BWY82_00437 [Verrucomicrobia bacterium ADurb.Bin474]|nr:MAG: hypothetical protein BWY82_00437 [Verrucomicrobia bacterium ADurb.Bin474]